MSGLVIKAWRADVRPIDNENNFVFVTGRQSGLVSWLLSLVRIDPTTTIVVGSERVSFESASLAGTESRLIPLEGICSTYYGYHKPWKAAAWITALAVFLAFSFGAVAAEGGSQGFAFITFVLTTMIGFCIALIYYFLNRTLTLGFVENSGHISGIRFKRSVIENIDIDESEARAVCILVQRLIEAKASRLLRSQVPSTAG
jgi:hypothetical protein